MQFSVFFVAIRPPWPQSALPPVILGGLAAPWHVAAQLQGGPAGRMQSNAALLTLAPLIEVRKDL